MVVVLDHLTHKNVLIPCTKDELGFSSTHGTTKPNSHTDMRRIKRASKMLLRIAPESWVGDSNVDDDRFASASIFVRLKSGLNRQMAGLSRAAIWSHLGFLGRYLIWI